MVRVDVLHLDLTVADRVLDHVIADQRFTSAEQHIPNNIVTKGAGLAVVLHKTAKVIDVDRRWHNVNGNHGIICIHRCFAIA